MFILAYLTCLTTDVFCALFYEYTFQTSKLCVYKRSMWYKNSSKAIDEKPEDQSPYTKEYSTITL